MNAFLVDLENTPGAVAAVAQALGAKGVNITGVSGSTCGDGGRLAFVGSDDAATRLALEGIGASYSECELVESNLSHIPGSLGRATRRLAEAGINIEAIMATGMSGPDVTVGFATDNPTLAREVLAASSTSIR